MKTKFLIIILLFSFNCVRSQKWQLVWSEEFNYTGLPDSSIWNYEYGQSIRNRESQFYTRSRKENSFVEDGTLKITAIKESFDGKKNNYTSAALITRNKAEFQYGKIEVCARLPKGVGIWPAIWMLPSHKEYGGWPNCGEIDIMEFVGFSPDTIHTTVHTGKFNHTIGTQKGHAQRLTNLNDKFHIYSIEWFPNKIDFLLDDNKVFTFNKEGDTPEYWPFDKPFYLIMNIAIGGGWGGMKGIDDSIFPQTMEIDYIRVYKEK
ncbi:MAG: glycoside hydrolase family 16 protein [Bacteroidales bacterium]|nr:glycoside hydrolase family 16 protein [Bacteroidales bacterium]